MLPRDSAAPVLTPRILFQPRIGIVPERVDVDVGHGQSGHVALGILVVFERGLQVLALLPKAFPARRLQVWPDVRGTTVDVFGGLAIPAEVAKGPTAVAIDLAHIARSFPLEGLQELFPARLDLDAVQLGIARLFVVLELQVVGVIVLIGMFHVELVRG